MEAAWTCAAIPSERVVLRLRLRPYCYGHELLLHHLGSPLVVVERSVPPSRAEHPILPVDLLLAAVICSQTYAGALSLIHSPIRLGLFVRVWRWLFCRGMDFLPELAAFQAYRAEGRWQPKLNIQLSGKGQCRTPKGPAAAHILVFLQEVLGMSEDAALELPMSRAHFYYFSHADAHGKVDLSVDGEFSPMSKALAEAEAKGESAWDF